MAGSMDRSSDKYQESEVLGCCLANKKWTWPSILVGKLILSILWICQCTLSIPNECKNLTHYLAILLRWNCRGLKQRMAKKLVLEQYVMVSSKSLISYPHSQFQPFTYDRGNNPNYDMVLGMAFSKFGGFFFWQIHNVFITSTSVRNVYSLFDYGDFNQNSSTLKNPYIQLHSITDMAEGIFFSRPLTLMLTVTHTV